ncbi:glycerate kinase [Paenibacillus sp. NEAU-GSW1]|uniref:glycerate kinase n=1 Tax=Paenibacillus sp. NEAU-GSW1 TaxID=2682486 RepID=UPI00139CEBB4|nr:glycerate kinase [Paenibacillus sp. NEAU-GSW1]
MNIVIAPDKFKGSLSAQQVGQALARGVRKACPDSGVTVIPMADGGEGTMECLVDAAQGRVMRVPVQDPLGRAIEAGFGLLDNGAGITCVIEMAKASGLYLLKRHERNPLLTTTYGVGQLMKAALDTGCRRFIMALGGSATNDGGAGMLQALGAQLLDADGQQIGYGGGSLSDLASIGLESMDPRLAECQFTVACDVDNPFVGSNGASAVFGPQKGATPEMARQLDCNLRHFADLIHEATGIAIHDVPGAGAAGGLSGGIMAFLRGELASGVSIVAGVTKLEEAIQGADLVITGEGQVDRQTAQGKAPCGVARIAKAYGIPVIVVAGSIGEGIDALYEQGVSAVVSIVNRPMSLEEAVEQSEPLLEQAGEQVMRIFSCCR